MSTPSFQILVCGFELKMMEMENPKGTMRVACFLQFVSNIFSHDFTHFMVPKLKTEFSKILTDFSFVVVFLL